MENAQMIRGRFLRWHEAKMRYRAIVEALDAGKVVVVATYTKATQYEGSRHAERFKATRTGLYALHGQKWLCIDGCSIRFASHQRKAS